MTSSYFYYIHFYYSCNIFSIFIRTTFINWIQPNTRDYMAYWAVTLSTFSIFSSWRTLVDNNIIWYEMIILLDYDLIFIPPFIIYTIGYQWAWNFNIYLWNTFSSYVDQYLIPITLAEKNIIHADDLINRFSTTRSFINNSSLIIPLYSVIKMYLFLYYFLN